MTTTRDRLLDTAEALFSEHGIHATSLRTLTAAAGANLAAVNYHFGSKEGLVREVFARRLRPLNERRLALLDEALEETGGKPLALEAIVRAFLDPALDLLSRSPEGTQRFALLMARTIMATDPVAMRFVHAELAEVIARFQAALAGALPELSAEEILQRFHFMVGAMVHTIVQTVRFREGIRPPEELDPEVDLPGLGVPLDLESTRHNLIAFLVAGLASPPAATPRKGTQT